jgi:hypothetical protein
MTANPYVVFRLTGSKSHERSLWMRPGNAETLTVRGVETISTGDSVDVAGVSAEVWVPPSKLDEWKKTK